MKYDLAKFESHRPIETAQKLAKLREQDAISFFHEYSTSFVERDCPVCGSSKKETLKDFLGIYGISKCRKCRLIYANPCPSREALTSYYSTSLSTRECNQLREADSNRNSRNFDSRLTAIETVLSERKNKHTSILEIGCSTGGFIERCIEYFGNSFDFSMSGVELDPRSTEIALSKGLNVKCANIEDIVTEGIKERYDLVVHFELIEHLTGPRSFIGNCYALLNDGGVMYFSTPNYEGLDNVAIPYDFPQRLMAHAIFPPFHLSGFNATSVCQLLSNAGFLDMEVSTPGRLDIELIRVHSERSEVERPYSDLLRLDSEALGIFQEIISRLGSSSHMHVRACK